MSTIPYYLLIGNEEEVSLWSCRSHWEDFCPDLALLFGGETQTDRIYFSSRKLSKLMLEIRGQQPTNCLILFDHIVGLALKELSHTQLTVGRYEYLILDWKFEFLFIILEVKFWSVLEGNIYRFSSSFWVRLNWSS